MCVNQKWNFLYFYTVHVNIYWCRIKSHYRPTRQSILGSNGMTMYDCSLSLWLLLKLSWSHIEVILKSSWSHPEVIPKSSWSHHEVCLIIWAKNKKIEYFRALCAKLTEGQMDRQTEWHPELLLEPNNVTKVTSGVCFDFSGGAKFCLQKCPPNILHFF